jgi:hypothetical protein
VLVTQLRRSDRPELGNRVYATGAARPIAETAAKLLPGGAEVSEMLAPDGKALLLPIDSQTDRFGAPEIKIVLGL